jgi:GH43 family beta-xylosidase
MENPYTLRGERILLATPIYPWEQQTLALLEGPEILKRNGRIFIIYSASASWTRHYCLGMLSLKNGGDPLNRSHWERADKPVFASSDKNGSFGVGHCCFVKSGGEDWIVYHGMSDGEGWHNRDVRAQRFTWNADDTPDFGEPAAVDA